MTNKQQRAGRRAWITRRKNAAILKKGGVAAVAIYKRHGLSDWHSMEAAGVLVKKNEQRRRVADFLLENHGLQQMTLCSLPGSRWELERAIEKARPGTKFIALERDMHFVKTARLVFDRLAPGGKLSEDENGSLSNEQSRLLLIGAGEFGTVRLTNPLTAMHYDGMGTMSAEDFLAFLKSLRKKITGEIPAVFTLLKGREAHGFFNGIPGGVLATRVRKLIRLCRKFGLDFQVKSFWSYKSDSGGPLEMMNICGLLSVRKRRTQVGPKPARWNEFSLSAYRKLCDQLQVECLAGFLGVDINNARRWLLGGSGSPDQVAQVQLRQLVDAAGEWLNR